MFKIVTLLCIVSAVWTQEANCELVSDSTNKAFILVDETQLIQLSDYIRGYNLEFTPSTRLTPPFSRSDTQPLPPLPDGSTLISLDMLTNSNKAWAQRGALLLNQPDQKSLILFGSLNTNYNLNFTKQAELTFATPTTCFGIVMVGIETAIVDCQQDDGLDVVAIVEPKLITKTSGGQSVKVTGRKSVGVVTGDGVYVLAAMLNDKVEKEGKGKNRISVYQVDLENKLVKTLDKITASTLNLDSLSITDITVNSQGKVYVTDEKAGIIRFNYNSSGVSSLQSSPFSNPRKISSYISPSGQQLLFIATPTAIAQSQWSTTPTRYYQLPSNIGQIRDLQASAHTIMLKNQDNYYFYRPGQTSIKNLMYAVANAGTVGTMDQQTPQAIVVGLKNSLAYVVSNGYFKLDGSEEAEYTIEATSQSPVGNKTCSVTFSTTVVTEDMANKILVMKNPPTSQSAQSPVSFDLKLDDYYAGPFNQYSTTVSPGIDYSFKFVEDFKVNGHVNLLGVDFMTTFSINHESYYRITKGGDTYSSQLCNYDKVRNQVNCEVAKTFRITGNILTYDVFLGNSGGKSLPVFAYISDADPTTLQFQPLANGQGPASLSFNFSIAHVQANSLYLFLTVRDNPEVLIYEVNTYRLFNTISTSSFTSDQLETIIRFKPRFVTLSPINPNVVFITNLQSVIVMKFSETGLFFISNIQIFKSAYNTVFWKTIATENRLVIIIKDSPGYDKILEYSIEDIFKPVFIKNINYAGFIFNPFEVYHAENSEMIFVRVEIDYFIAFKLNAPAVKSHYFTFHVRTNFLLGVAEINQNVIVQQANHTDVTQIIYPHPQLRITVATPEYSFKKSFSYGFHIRNTFQDQLDFNGTMTVFNYQTQIKERDIKNDAISLPQTAEKQWVDLNVNQLFNGSITNYKIQCNYCAAGKITLIDHINFISKSPILPSPALSLLNIKPLSLILAITSKSLHTFQYNGTLANQTVLLSTCPNSIHYLNSTVILICKNQTDQYFLVVDVVTMVQQDPIVIPDNFRVDNPLKLEWNILKNQLLVLDNNLRGNGNGIVRVFSVSYTDGTGVDIQPAATIDYVNFGCKSKTLISSIAIINTTKTNNSTLVVMTLQDVGFGYIVHTPAGWREGRLVDLSLDKKILDYVLDNNKFLQLLVLNGDKNTDLVVKNLVVLTMSSGAHLELSLNFNRSDETFVYNSFDIINSFNKYGKQTVLNSATFHPLLSTTVSLGWLSVAYYNESTNTLTNSLYEIPVQVSPSPTNFKTSQTFKAPTLTPIPSAFFSTGAQIHLVSPTQSTLSIYNVSSKTYMLLSYDTPDKNCDTIKVIAKNDYGIAQHNVAVKFVSPEPDDSGLGWYIWLLAGLGGVFVLGMIYGVIRFTRRKIRERKKISLLTEDEERV